MNNKEYITLYSTFAMFYVIFNITSHTPRTVVHILDS